MRWNTFNPAPNYILSRSCSIRAFESIIPLVLDKSTLLGLTGHLVERI